MSCRLFVLIAVSGLAVCGCRTEATVAMRQPIEMGPFTFVVERAYDDATASESRCGAIVVDLRLMDADGAKVHFDDFLNDMTEPALIVHPATSIVDRAGHRYTGWVRRVSGRDQWRATFPLSYEDNLLSEAKCSASRRAVDFSLTIRNPESRRGQRSRISIALG